MKILHGVFYILLFGLQLVYSQWEFAVTTQNKIIFYNEDWSIITTAAHQFEQLSAITFDESEERIYFNDLSHNNGSIFSLKLSSDSDGNHITEKVLAKTQDEAIAGLAYDPLEQNIYWTDAKNKKIYRLSTQQPNQTPTVLFDFTKEDAIPDGIAIDVCRRKLYWTNSNHKHPSIERSSLNGSKREVLINTDLFSPHGIFIDQFSNRMFWLVDQPGSHYSVESANLDGTDRQAVVEGLNNVPFSLAVTKSSIYWTDLTHSAIWNVSKTNNKTEKPSKVLNFPAHPKGVVARVHFLSRMGNDTDCKEVVKNIKTRILTPATSKSMIEIKQKNMKIDNFCLNKGEYNEHSGTCICKVGFTGSRCEVDSCQNFCVHGTCHLSSMGFPECTCQEGFSGDRCEIFKCHDYCLNEGRCEILNDVPICHCPESHTGSRCEKNTTEVCSLHCKLRTYEPENFVPFNCWEICDEESSGDQSRYKQSHQQTGSCSSTYNKTVIFVVVGVLTSLILVYLIIQALRRIYKPARPRIKKTFVVQKKISQTPLTSRPMATEQCEITIENCCNMNICDTPCFDPKLLQQNMTFDTNTKEDKKILINNMEEDLY